MNSEQDLIKRLMVSKQIMDKHNTISRGQIQDTISTPVVEDYKPIKGTYNIPQDLMEEVQPQRSFNTEVPTEDKIMNSKLPDEIKRLMLEHPIDKPTMGVQSGVGLSNDLVERASRLMKNDNKIQENTNQNIVKSQKQQFQGDDIRKIVRETVEDVLRENGLLTEGETKTNDVFKFRVGQHIFEGKVLKVRKVVK
jgi:hypothetical protein